MPTFSPKYHEVTPHLNAYIYIYIYDIYNHAHQLFTPCSHCSYIFLVWSRSWIDIMEPSFRTPRFRNVAADCQHDNHRSSQRWGTHYSDQSPLYIKNKKHITHLIAPASGKLHGHIITGSIDKVNQHEPLQNDTLGTVSKQRRRPTTTGTHIIKTGRSHDRPVFITEFSTPGETVPTPKRGPCFSWD